MKVVLTYFKLMSIMLITLSFTPAISCTQEAAADPDPARSPIHSARYSDILGADFEDFLIKAGQGVLRQLYNDVPVDHERSNLFEGIDADLERIKAKAKYSLTADWAFVSNAVRRYYASTDKTYITKRKNHLAAILSICWALTQQADDQKEFFKRGSFTLIDPGHKLYNFLLDYVKLVTGSDNPLSLPFEQTVSNFAYQRNPKMGQSTHHVERSPESQFGIDMRLEPQEGVLMILPHSYTHVLFGKLDVGGQETPLTFIKLEEIGLGSKGAIAAHALSLQRSRQFVEEDARREKDIRRELSLSFKLLKEIAKKQNVAIAANTTTIRTMFLTARQHTDDANAKIAYEAKEFLRRLEDNYPYGHHDLRVGNEVILDLSAFLNLSAAQK